MGDAGKIIPCINYMDIDCQSIVPNHLRHYSGNSILIRCLWHNDSSPSCHIYKENYHCYSCGAHGKSISLYMALYQVDRDTAVTALESGNYPTILPEPRVIQLPEEILAKELHYNLTNEAMYYYVVTRGLTPNIVEEYQLGWGSLYPNGPEGYTIPIYQDNRLRQIKQRLPKVSKNKYRSLSNCGAYLFLGEDLAFQPKTFLAGGEFDAITLRQYGYIAAAPTSGEKRFAKEWTDKLVGTTPYCVYDNDERGEEGYLKLKELFPVKRIYLPTKDCNEFFLKYDPQEFEQLIKEADKRYNLRRI